MHKLLFMCLLLKIRHIPALSRAYRQARRQAGVSLFKQKPQDIDLAVLRFTNVVKMRIKSGLWF